MGEVMVTSAMVMASILLGSLLHLLVAGIRGASPPGPSEPEVVVDVQKS